MQNKRIQKWTGPSRYIVVSEAACLRIYYVNKYTVRRCRKEYLMVQLV